MGYKRVKFTPYAARSVQEGVLCPPGPVRSLSQAAKLQTGEIGRFDPESLVLLSPQKDPKGTKQPPIPKFKRKSFIRSHPAMPPGPCPFPHRSLRRLTQAARACSAGSSLRLKIAPSFHQKTEAWTTWTTPKKSWDMYL